ncbi:replication protein A 70 kDa DNA-binding subunit B [Tanacetum coccineum]
MKGKFGYQKESKSQQKENRSRTNESKSQPKGNKALPTESKSSSKKKTLKHSPAMQPSNKITPIKDVSPMVSNMSIKGRVISIWHGHKLNQAHDPYSLEGVLQDEHGDRIQVYVKKDWMFRFEPLLQDGICYLISNFGVTENGGRLPLLPHDWKLLFYRNTNVTRIDQFDDNFTGFKSEPFTRILDTNEEYEEHNSVDVIGTVVGIGEIVAVNSIGSKKIRRTVVIEDEEYESREEYDANKNKIQLVAHEPKVVTPQQFLNGAVKKLVGSIRETKPDTECVIYASVHSIQYESGWTYIGCKVCSKKVEPVAAKGPYTSRTKQTWWCTKHESQEQVSSRVKFSEFNHNNNSHVYRCERVTNDEEIINFWKQGFVEDQVTAKPQDDKEVFAFTEIAYKDGDGGACKLLGCYALVISKEVRRVLALMALDNA